MRLPAFTDGRLGLRVVTVFPKGGWWCVKGEPVGRRRSWWGWTLGFPCLFPLLLPQLSLEGRWSECRHRMTWEPRCCGQVRAPAGGACGGLSDSDPSMGQLRDSRKVPEIPMDISGPLLHKKQGQCPAGERPPESSCFSRLALLSRLPVKPHERVWQLGRADLGEPPSLPQAGGSTESLLLR